MPARPTTLINVPQQWVARLLALAVPPIVAGVLLIRCADWRHPLPVPNREVAKMMGSAVALWAGLGLVISAGVMRFFASKVRRILDRIAEDDCLIHWKYTDQDWEAYLATETVRLCRRRRSAFWVFAAMGLVVGLVMVASIPNRREGVWVGVAMLLLLLTIGASVAVCSSLYHGSRVRRLRVAGGEAIISRDAAYCCGDLQCWGTAVRTLVGARLLPGAPTIIELTIRWSAGTAGNMLSWAAAASGRYYASKTDMAMRIPVPAGQEQSAQQVIAELLSSIRLRVPG